MSKQLFIGLAVEGSTDMRFLKSIVSRTFQSIVFDRCEQDVDVDVFELRPQKTGKDFPEFVAAASRDGIEKCGIMVLAVHADSDRETLKERLQDKFIPAQDYLNTLDENRYCRVLTPIIPIRMIEAWMLADTELLKEEMGTNLSDAYLGFHRSPETIADPKAIIQEAIVKAQNLLPKKRRMLSIGDLYGIIGDRIALTSLFSLSSYRWFYNEAIKTLEKIHYIV